MVFVVGLTGGIGSGKTTVSDSFSQKGIEIIDADLIAREVVLPKTHAILAIREKFGNKICLEDGSLNRRALREHIFTHPDDKAWLNALLHPMIRKRMITHIKNIKSPYCLLVAPLLLENGLEKLCQRVLVIDVLEKTQILRTTKRDKISAAHVKKIIAAQIPRETRLAMADDIIQNDHAEVELSIQVNTLHQHYLALSNKERVSHEP